MLKKTRNKLYRSARLIGDIQAAVKGPHKLIKRKARRGILRIQARGLLKIIK